MGIPSISIYVNELISEFGAKTLIRIGTCGGLQPELSMRDVIFAMAASTDSMVNKLRFNGMDYAPAASFTLLKKAYEVAVNKGIDAKVGNVFTSDSFYSDDPDAWKRWARYGVLAIEMETAALYTLAAKFRVDALSILTVSDDMLTGQEATPEERQTTYTQMIEIALEIG
jgi:purine-nucleoside phosphorylase